jgi:hypothetical protein
MGGGSARNLGFAAGAVVASVLRTAPLSGPSALAFGAKFKKNAPRGIARKIGRNRALCPSKKQQRALMRRALNKVP